MQEGAVTVEQKGLVVYAANRRFADFIGAPLELVMGSSFFPRPRLHGGPGAR